MNRYANIIIGALFAAALCFLGDGRAAAQTFLCGPSFFYYGAVPSTGTWENCFGSMQPTIGYVPLNKAGDTMLGPLGVTHLFGASGIPTVAAGAGAGTGPTISLPAPSFDSDFTISLTTGSSPTGSNATIATVTFSTTYASQPNCTFSASNPNAASLSGATGVYGAPAPAGASWALKSGSTALSASTTYSWDVICQG